MMKKKVLYHFNLAFILRLLVGFERVEANARSVRELSNILSYDYFYSRSVFHE